MNILGNEGGPKVVSPLKRAFPRKTRVKRPIATPKVARPRKPPAPKITKPKKPKPLQPTPITKIRSMEDLQKAAAGQVDSELSSEINPLTLQAKQTQGREAAAANELSTIFGQLNPMVSDMAHMVSDNYDKTNAAEQALFSAAGQKLNSLKQQAASEAQNLAQQIGGPVAVDKFTGAIDPSITAFTSESAGSLLHSMGTGQAGVQEMADWAGKVYPLIQTEKQAGVRQQYETQISKLQDQISTLKGSRTGKVNDRLNTLLGQEREYQINQKTLQLNQAKQALDRLSTIHALKNDDARLALAKGQFGLSKYQAVTGVRLKAKELQLAAKKLTASQKEAAQKLGISNQQMAERIRHNQETEAIARSRVQVQRQKNAAQMAQALANPKSLKPMTLTHKVYVPKNQELAAASGRIKAYWDPKRKHYYQYVKETITTQEWMRRHGFGSGTTNPKQMFQILKNMGVPASIAAGQVKKATGVDPRKGKK